MPKVTYITSSGNEIVVPDAEDNLMQAAVENEVEGILGDCGGVAACATCHVHIDPQWVDTVGPPNDIEQGMLSLLEELADNSRLGCQVEITPDLDGLVVRVVGQ